MTDPMTESREAILRREQAVEARQREFLAFIGEPNETRLFADTGDDDPYWNAPEDDAGEGEGPTEFVAPVYGFDGCSNPDCSEQYGHCGCCDMKAEKPAPARSKGSEAFHALLREIGELHDRKQKDYGSNTDPFANVRASQDFGVPAWVGALVRLNDK